MHATCSLGLLWPHGSRLGQQHGLAPVDRSEDASPKCETRFHLSASPPKKIDTWYNIIDIFPTRISISWCAIQKAMNDLHSTIHFLVPHLSHELHLNDLINRIHGGKTAKATTEKWHKHSPLGSSSKLLIPERFWIEATLGAQLLVNGPLESWKILIVWKFNEFQYSSNYVRVLNSSIHLTFCSINLFSVQSHCSWAPEHNFINRMPLFHRAVCRAAQDGSLSETPLKLGCQSLAE